MRTTLKQLPKIYLDAPQVGDLERKYLSEAIDTGYVSSVGPFVSEFEHKFATFIGVKHAVSTQSGTAALHMALHELSIGPGDEVIVPALTFVATANPVAYVGAKPVFVDVSEDTWTMLPEAVAANLTKKTTAIIPVHLYGNPCDMVAIMALAKKKGLYVIEDATESLGAKINGQHTGTFGHFGCFSFNGNKTITTGGGGMVVGRDESRIQHISFLVNQARNSLEEYFHSEIGFNYRMTNLEAALGLAQMAQLEQILARKQQINAIYRDQLKGIDAIRFQKTVEGAAHSCWLTTIAVDEKKQWERIQQNFSAKGLPIRKVFMPLVEFPPYRDARRELYANAYRIFDQGLCLPSSVLNSDEDIQYVCDVIKEIF